MAACLVVMLLVLMPGAYIARDGYEFVPDTERWVALRNGLSFTIGKLDKKGNFLPDRRWVNLRGASYSGGPPATMLNSPDDEPVYEFRSGRLVKGRIDKEGSFVPDLGAKVIRFEDYKPGEDVTRIYNLPRKFVPKAKAGKKD